MSTRYYNLFVKAFAAAGGHPGSATLSAVMPQAKALKEAGATSKVAGMACATSYKLHRQIERATW